MTLYIGDIPISYVSSFNADRGSKNIEEIAFIGEHVVPYLSESNRKLLDFEMNGTLLEESGNPATLDDLAERILTIKDRRAPFNYIHDFQSRSGWVGLKEARSDKNAHSLVTRPYNMEGKFLPKNSYQLQMHSNPIILSNDFSLTLGSGGCDNYIPIPIGATYSGGDDSTISRIGKDGTITLVKATTNKDINWDLAADEVDVGECKVWDMMDSNTESDWVRVFNPDHVFSYSGNGAVIDNGYVRVRWNNATGLFDFYVYNGSTYSNIGRIKTAGTTHLGIAILFAIDSITPDQIIIKIKHSNTADVTEYLLETLTINRGHPYITRDNYLTSGFINPRLEITDLPTKKIAYLNGDKLCDDGIDADGLYTGSKTLAYTTCFDALANVIYGIGSVDNANAQVGYISGGAITEIYQIVTPTASAFLWGIPFSGTVNLFKECENMTPIGPGTHTPYTGVDASPTTGTTGDSVTGISNTGRRYGYNNPLTGTYKLFTRCKNSAATKNLRVVVIGAVNGTLYNNTNHTLTTTFAYYDDEITIPSDETNITVEAVNMGLSGETLTLDYILLVPITLDNGNGPQDIARQAMVDQRMQRELIQR